MPDHLAHGFAARGQIGARIEGFGALRKQGPDGGGDGQPQIRINIDLANGGSGGAAKQVFGHAGGSRDIPAVRVDGSHGHQRHARQTGGDGVKALEIKPRLPRKLAGAVTRPDGNGKRIASGTGYKCFCLFGIGINGFAGRNGFLDPGEPSEFGFDPDTPVMGVLHDATFSSKGRCEPSIMTEVNPSSMQALQMSKPDP